MSSSTEISPNPIDEEQEVEEGPNFERLGLDPRLIRAVSKKGIEIPTPIQQAAIPLILEGKDVLARAKTGSGKTFAYLLPLLQKLFSDSAAPTNKQGPSAFILLPTQELCQQVYLEVVSLIDACRVQLKVVQLTSAGEMTKALAGQPDILVATPGRLQTCFSLGVLQPKSVQESLSMLILDEADLLLTFGYENNLKDLKTHIPKRCQCLLMSATLSVDVEKLKTLILHNPYILTLPEINDVKDEIVPKSVQQFWIKCGDRDKYVDLLVLLQKKLVETKVLIFTNTIDTSFKLKLFLEQFGIKSAVLNAELPINSRLHILEGFNAGLFDYLIATDDNSSTEKEHGDDDNHVKQKKSKKRTKHKFDSEFGVVRGIDFKGVHTVINFDMPPTPEGYVHRIGRTGRANNTGQSISLVSPEEMETFKEIKFFFGENEDSNSTFIAEFPLLFKNAVENMRYRAEDILRSATSIAVREARAQDLRNEIINSEKLKAHFEHNPRDLDLLKHDKTLSKKAPAPHLKDVPDYLLDPTTEQASKIVKLSRTAMGRRNNSAFHKGGSKGKFRKSGDPLKTFSAGVKKHGSGGGGMQKKRKDGPKN